MPALSCFFSASGSASASTLRPTDSAVFGETPEPTPPFFSPAMAFCNCEIALVLTSPLRKKWMESAPSPTRQMISSRSNRRPGGFISS